MTRLSLTVPHFDDETLASYCSRVAAVNGIGSAAEFASHLGFSFNGLADGRSEDVECFAHLVGKDVSELLDSIVYRSGKLVRVRGELFTTDFLEYARSRFCPRCLMEDRIDLSGSSDHRAHLRTAWLVKFVRACPVHGSALVTFKNKRQLANDLSAQCRLDANAFERLAENCRPLPITPLQSYVLSRLKRETTRSSLWLDRLPLQAAAHFTELLGAIVLHGKALDIECHDEADGAACSMEGFKMVAKGETSVKKFLRSLAADYEGTKYPAGLDAVFGRLAIELQVRQDHVGYMSLLGMLQEIAMAELPLGNGDTLVGPKRFRQTTDTHARPKAGVASSP